MQHQPAAFWKTLARWGAVQAGVLVLGACMAFGDAGDAPSLPNYFTRFWQRTDGLPDNNVTCVTQTQDGYLWVGTRSGLARFDGVQFTTFDASNTPQMQSRHITSLFEGADGTLWIGHDSGEVTAYKDGEFRSIAVPATWRSGKIFGISSDAAGDVWLLNHQGDLARVKDAHTILSPPDAIVHLLSLTKSRNGDLWVQRDSAVAVVKNGQLTRLDSFPAGRYIQGIAAAAEGGLWVLSQSQIEKWKDGSWTADLGAAPWGWSPVHNAIETRNGYLAAATVDHGLYLVFPDQGSRQFSRSNGFSSDWVTSLCEDREGNLWAGTANGGLAMLRPVNITTLNPPDQWQGRAVLSVAAGADGSLWAGTEGAGVYRFLDGNWTSFDEESGLSNRYVWSVTFDAQQRLWAGTWGDGLYLFNGTGFDSPVRLPNESVGAMLGNAGGGLHVGTSAGLFRFTGDTVTSLVSPAGAVSPDVRAIKTASNGAVWFGMSGGGLGLLKNGNVRQFRRSDGLSSDFAQCLFLESDDVLWIGTAGGGLNRYKDGRFAAVTKKHGLPSDVICDIQEDGLGYFWISSHNGITRVEKSELHRIADKGEGQLDCMNYGAGDGLPTLECSGGSQPAGCRTADGSIWFPTAKGLVGIDPGNVTTNPLAPPVLIEQMLVDGKTVTESSDEAGVLRIPPGRHQIKFNYTGLSFTAPNKVRFRYRLEGLDEQWIEAETERAANYNYIPPGPYKFHVIACNNDGVWNNDGASTAFVVLPFFWQTAWFRVLGGALTLLLGGGLAWLEARRRMRRKMERIERQRAIERERARIAQDIHDDLGASLTRITMLSQSTPVDGDPSRQVETTMHQIYGTARELTRAMDEIVWAVNPKHDTLDSLANYLGKFAQDFLGTAHIRCRLDVPMHLPQWPLTAEVRHNVFLALKEALNNVVKHSAATEVRVSLTLDDTTGVLEVEDNGKGFDVKAVRDHPTSMSDRVVTGQGLLNMERRLAEIGGRWEIRSTHGTGTTVKFIVPLRATALE